MLLRGRNWIVIIAVPVPIVGYTIPFIELSPAMELGETSIVPMVADDVDTWMKIMVIPTIERVLD